MTIKRTVEIPASYRITIDVPREIPVGKAIITFTPATSGSMPVQQDKKVKPLDSYRGVHKGLDTLDAYFERKRADKAKEDAQIEKQLRRSKGLE